MQELVEIRAAEPEDLAAVHSIEVQEEGDHAAPMSALAARQRSFPETFLVATKQGDVIGYLEAVRWHRKEYDNYASIKNFHELHEQKGPFLYIIFLCVHAQHRGKGVGSRMLRASLDIARSQGCLEVHLVSLLHLIDFYARFGFRSQGRLPNFLPGIDGVLMKKQLSTTTRED